MSVEICNFVYKLKNFSQDTYINNDVGKLNQDLKEINEMYDKLMTDENINNMTKEYILSKFIKVSEVTMYMVPVIKNMSNVLLERYNKFYCIQTESELIF